MNQEIKLHSIIIIKKKRGGVLFCFALLFGFFFFKIKSYPVAQVRPRFMVLFPSQPRRCVGITDVSFTFGGTQSLLT